jgi:hypothetical protein
MRPRLDAVSWILIAVTLIATAIVLGTAESASAACNKFCGFCGSSCVQRDDPACSYDGLVCVVRVCKSTFMCRNMLICGVTCQSDPNCCATPGFVDDCGGVYDCVYIYCPCRY